MFGIKKHTLFSPDSHGILTPVEGGRTVECDNFRCCHCQAHVTVTKGSGKRRGFCQRCNAKHCGGPDCWECVPFEQKLENRENGRPDNWTPTTVNVPKLWVPGDT